MSLRAALAIYMSAWVRARRGSVSETGTPRRTCCGQRMDKARTCPGHSRTLPGTRGHGKARRRCRDSARVAYCCAGAHKPHRQRRRVAHRRGARWPRTRLGKVAWGCSLPAGVSSRIYISRGRSSAHHTRTRTRTSTYIHADTPAHGRTAHSFVATGLAASHPPSLQGPLNSPVRVPASGLCRDAACRRDNATGRASAGVWDTLGERFPGWRLGKGN